MALPFLFDLDKIYAKVLEQHENALDCLEAVEVADDDCISEAVKVLQKRCMVLRKTISDNREAQNKNLN